MSKKSVKGEKSELRKRAEEVLKDRGSCPTIAAEETEQLRLIHELQVHQIELEIQNDELSRSKEEIESLLCKYSDLYDFSPVGYLTLDPVGNILEANLTSARFLEMERSKLIGQRFISFMTVSDRHDFANFLNQVFLSRGKEACEVVIPQKNNAALFVQIEAIALKGDNQCRIAMIDVNDRKMVEEASLRAEKLESLGQLGGGIAHDFNNLLTVILGNIAITRAQNHAPGQREIHLKNIEKAAEKAKNLTMQLLTFARGGAPIKKVINIEDVLRSAVAVPVHGSLVMCQLDFPPDLLAVEADADQLTQVFHNLIHNAFHAMPDKGVVEISAENTVTVSGRKKMVKISFHDSGPGLSQEDLAKIFDPYYSMKLNGCGLGLAVCYSIVKKHYGDIQVNSTANNGTTFTVLLPAAPTSQVFEPHDEIRYGSGRILLMDDEAAIRDVLKALLKELGYEVECSGDGCEAIDLYQKRKTESKPFDLVILDITVPGGMGGEEAVEELRRLDPQVKAIVSSGYSTDPIMANYKDYGFTDVLRKPYQLAELSQVIADVLKD
ncbi:His Kinase A (phospho-acceptor) domain-containing protein [Malonomonas rubra DSM 5091]|uniref:histidine kinase n=1 Tax=Malonomonas rubra DSM 5091 TaxID=1122189 RepID=A0A1M6FP89_MALRU|nr:PAS domain-containing hybrid sensor histidine kinase/response regulator [Malonomonas rubra]SHI99558.1 His Kinase A (phospho-acceptor) domain-containing protein [Malonomonas rubra DSM 5091]